MKVKILNQQIADFFPTGGGTVSLFHPLSNKARTWLELHCPSDGEHQYFGNALVVEHRYLADIVTQAIADGLNQLQSSQHSNREQKGAA